MPDLSVLGFGPRGWGEALLWGALLTVQIALASYLLGLAIGLLGAWAKISGPRPVRALAGLYTTVMRGVPDILVILLVYYGGTSAVRSLVGLVSPGVTIEINAFAAAVASLGVIAGAYATEVFRGSIQAIPAGQFDAVRALSLPRIVGFRRVILPQALRLAWPPLGNLWLVVMKDAALISVVGLRDLLGVASSGASTTRMPFTFYAFVALVFLALSVVSMAGLHWAERAAGRGHRGATA